ncbi:DUF542 domain-containing protein [Vulgatibacter incomptus]|uniref:Nitric oxide-dependent regulator DnrN or NorA n=1 Tax=Vulgatibacter incomptus TaxID=1391653 RepID=A0A0K1PC92_9BACT|nr:DUF542 domain-containing protein [Vulgatibacter incomptus]AKU91158.1 Nitric oxide-dependent regulator DnrN or NorA [Vulgatibacter incomptus]
MLDSQKTVAQLVLDHSECAAVFQRHRIDYCCSGQATIATAAEEKRVDLHLLLSELGQAIEERADRAGTGTDPRTRSTKDLIGFVIARYHVPLRASLRFVQPLAMKVRRVHGDHNPLLVELDAVVTELAESLVEHMDVEEETLFPALLAEAPDVAVVARELQAMQADHLEVAGLLERMRAAAEDFRLPDWACNSYRTLFAELEKIEADLFEHVHLENHVLMPRFVAA